MKYLGNSVIFLLIPFFGYLYGDVSFMKPLFSTKTPYFWLKNAAEVVPENEFSTTLHNGQTCQIEGLNLLLRHGARYPTIKWIKRMSALQTRLQSNSFINLSHPFITKWNNPFAESQEGLLSALGEKEMTMLGGRFGKRFQVLLEGKIDDIKFAVTYKNRTKSSYKYFYQGLNETFPTYISRPKATEENTRFYKACNKYIEEVDDNDAILTEYEKFANGIEIGNVVQQVQNEIGNLSLDIGDVLVMQQICVFELGLYNKSDWCQFFNMTDLEVIDYMKDLKDYYKRGHAYNITWQQTCPFTSYMFQRFEEAVQNSAKPNRIPPVDITFGHGNTILPIYAAFNLFRDDHAFTADNFAVNKNRQFRTSKIVPFSANIAIALYKCEGNDDSHVVKMFVNEEEVIIPGCDGTVCSYTKFKNSYPHLVNCNFDQICDNFSSKCNHTRAYALLIWIIALVILHVSK